MANSVTVRVEINESNLKHAVNYAPGTKAALGKKAAQISANANSMAAGFRTGIFHDHETGETKGDTPARYESSAKMGSKGYVGIIYTANYSAKKENHLHNTLLKAKG